MSKKNPDIVESSIVPISSISPNDWNPNHMKDSVYEFLKKNIRTKGFYQPIICIEENGRYIIVDGEHRYRAAVEEGLQEVEIKVLDIPLSLAKAETINANRIRGDFSPAELGNLLTDIQASLDSSENIADICVIPEFEIELLTDISAEVEENSGREEVKKVQKNFQLMVRFENKKDMTTTKELLNNLLAEDGGVNMNGTMVKRALEAYILEN